MRGKLNVDKSACWLRMTVWGCGDQQIILVGGRVSTVSRQICARKTAAPFRRFVGTSLQYVKRKGGY
ncbi:hypothetical protein C8Q75DRAFT_785644 [Abortiporus biennis]|nr:hypothetical protein C8Q75DRAFT_785644 [Abortiporus biennis]